MSPIDLSLFSWQCPKAKISLRRLGGSMQGQPVPKVILGSDISPLLDHLEQATGRQCWILLQHFEDKGQKRINASRSGSFNRHVTRTGDCTPDRRVVKAKLSCNRTNRPFLGMEQSKDMRFPMGVESHDGVSLCY
jgi:hypothetical protein